jgi:hypothetical protein
MSSMIIKKKVHNNHKHKSSQFSCDVEDDTSYNASCEVHARIWAWEGWHQAIQTSTSQLSTKIIMPSIVLEGWAQES